ncbi:uncharacterized protein ARMOST_13885 [Armillaria ostoyae]|uniref:Uncharacterized protein n=1 Tax=Armillaria ostoyae TaxID=47428 RepID=A0A284RP16_ARMOS|nr:uncharacterized protein ARMOST_13885 [Armillaria ostoyae]
MPRRTSNLTYDGGSREYGGFGGGQFSVDSYQTVRWRRLPEGKCPPGQLTTMLIRNGITRHQENLSDIVSIVSDSAILSSIITSVLAFCGGGQVESCDRSLPSISYHEAVPDHPPRNLDYFSRLDVAEFCRPEVTHESICTDEFRRVEESGALTLARAVDVHLAVNERRLSSRSRCKVGDAEFLAKDQRLEKEDHFPNSEI